MVATRKVKPNVKRAKALSKLSSKPKSIHCSKCTKVIKQGECCIANTATNERYHVKCHALMQPKIDVEVLEASDQVLHNLILPNPCPIKVEIGTDRVTLYIGPRDMVWTRYNRALIAAGTSEAPDLPNEEHEETIEEIDANSTEGNAGSPNEKGEY